MKIKRIDPSLWVFFILAAFTLHHECVWAAPASCNYPKSTIEKGGSGMGGTGAIAKEAGIGGTGVRPDSRSSLMQIAGSVTLSSGTAEAQYNGETRHLTNNDSICVGETIATSKSAQLQIQMADGGLIELRSQTKLKIEKFVYGKTNKDSSLIALLEGTSRFVTGQIGKKYPQNDLIKTPTATIGVLGTDHEATVILPSEKNQSPAGTYDKVSSGITYISNDKGRVDIHSNQVGFAATKEDLPVLLKEMPDFYHIPPSAIGNDKSPEDNNAKNSEDIKSSGVDSEHPNKDAGHDDILEHNPPALDNHDIGDLMHPPEFHELPELPEEVDN